MIRDAWGVLRGRRVWDLRRWPGAARRLWLSLRLNGAAETWRLLARRPRSLAAAPDWPPLPPLLAPALPPPSFPIPEQPRVSVIVTLRGDWSNSADCLLRLAAQAEAGGFELLLAGPVPDCATAAWLQACRPLRAGTNGEAAAIVAAIVADCNRLVTRARGQYLVFLDSQVYPTTGWLVGLLRSFEDLPGCAAVGGRLLSADGRVLEAGLMIDGVGEGNGDGQSQLRRFGRGDRPDRAEHEFASVTEAVSGTCLALPRAVFEQHGGFDVRFETMLAATLDLCFRLRASAGSVWLQPACTVYLRDDPVEASAAELARIGQRWASLSEHATAVDQNGDERSLRRRRFRQASSRALVIDAVTPMPDQDSGSVRMAALLELMVEEGWLVSFAPSNLCWEGDYARALQHRGIELLTRRGGIDLQAWLACHGADLDLVMVSRHYVLESLLPSLRRWCPNARLVFDTVDLHYLRQQRQAELDGRAALRALAERTRVSELGLVRAADITLVVSPFEQRLLNEAVPAADVRVLSNIHTLAEPGPRWDERRDLLFVGGFQHPPNVDAAEWLIAEILPRARRQLPELRLHLVGSQMPDQLRHCGAEGVVVHGFVPELAPLLRSCRVSIAPLRYGAGVKGKVNQAMAWGLPVVATPLACEGMYLEHGRDVLVGSSAEALAAAVVRLHEDEQLWQALAEAGRANVAKHFSAAAARRVLAGLLPS